MRSGLVAATAMPILPPNEKPTKSTGTSTPSAATTLGAYRSEDWFSVRCADGKERDGAEGKGGGGGT